MSDPKNIDPKESLKQLLESRIDTERCRRYTGEMWKDEVFCNGLIYHEEGKVIQWPHLLVFEKPPLTEENVYNMVQDFNFQGKKAILRGAILGDGSTHF